MDMHSHSGTDLMDMDNCCKDIIKHVECQNDLNSDFTTLNFEQQVFVATFTYSYINLFEGLAQQVILYKNYTPPFIVKDIPVLNDTFLI